MKNPRRVVMLGLLMLVVVSSLVVYSTFVGNPGGSACDAQCMAQRAAEKQDSLAGQCDQKDIDNDIPVESTGVCMR